MGEGRTPGELPDLCAYPLAQAQALLGRVGPGTQVRIIETRPPGRSGPQGPLRVLRQRTTEDGVVELLVAAEHGGGPASANAAPAGAA